MNDKQFDKSEEWSAEELAAAFNKLADDDKQFDEDLQMLKSVEYEIQDFRFEGLLDSPAEKLAAAFNEAASDLYAIAHDIVERWGQSIVPLSQLSNDISLRTPDVIKKELKHAKNPMEIKRLNKELTTYYKEHKKRKGESK